MRNNRFICFGYSGFPPFIVLLLFLTLVVSLVLKNFLLCNFLVVWNRKVQVKMVCETT